MTRFRLLFIIGLLLIIPYGVAWLLGDLRANTGEFLLTFGGAFLLYAVACGVALNLPALKRREIAALFILTLAMMAPLFFTRPTLSDDMYRYVWEGRMQTLGISPYLSPPGAPELAELRDDEIWPHINRKGAVTVYPPAAELSFRLLWSIWPESVRWFQIAMALGALAAGLLLLKLLADLKKSPARLVIYLWSPLLLFETAHAAHVDGLVLPVLVAAWWARVRRLDILVGICLGVATAMKIYPALLLPALWRPREAGARWQMPVAFGLTVILCYLPFVVSNGAAVLGFLPNYFEERFNMGAATFLITAFNALGLDPNRSLLLLTLFVLGLLALFMARNPAQDGEQAVRRSIWLIGAFTLLTQNLFSWYMLWMLPLVALFVEPGLRLSYVSLPRLNGWTGWWLFCGLVVLSYSFFLAWRPVPWAIWAQFVPLYLLLFVDLARRGRIYFVQSDFAKNRTIKTQKSL
jgi:alpha-1,6-mannosyltransferase